MAKIKTLRVEHSGKMIEVSLNCNSSGVFSCTMDRNVAAEIGYNRSSTYAELKLLEDTLLKAFSSFKEARTSYDMWILVIFGVCGSFRDNTFADYDPNKFKLSLSFDQGSAVRLDYEVLLRENRDGRIRYFREEKNHAVAERRPWGKEFGGKLFNLSNDKYMGSNHDNKHVLIPFEQGTYDALVKITTQFKAASSFIFTLLNQDDVAFALANAGANVLNG